MGQTNSPWAHFCEVAHVFSGTSKLQCIHCSFLMAHSASKNSEINSMRYHLEQCSKYTSRAHDQQIIDFWHAVGLIIITNIYHINIETEV